MKSIPTIFVFTQFWTIYTLFTTL